MRVIGIDISGGFATAVLLDKQPASLAEYYRSTQYTPFDFEPNHADLMALVNLRPDCVAWEPTGTHYELVYHNWFQRHGIEVKRIAAKRVASYRSDNGLDKTDGTDALAIASYTLKRYDDPSAFIQECYLREIRELYLQRQGLVRIQRRYCQRLRLQLHHEFPEATNAKLNSREWASSGFGLIAWLSGNGSGRTNARWEKLHNGGVVNKNSKNPKAIAPTIGTGVSDYSRWLAKHVWEIWEQCREIECRFDAELNKQEMQIYLKAFQAVGISVDCQIAWLTRIYPFERFLRNGKENTIKRLNGKGKLCKYNLSLSQFKAALGAGTVRNESGQKQGKNVRMSKVRLKRMKKRSQASSGGPVELPIGDRLCRTSYFMWHMGAVERGVNTGTHAEAIRSKNEEQRQIGKNGFQRAGNLHGYVARILYRELKSRLLTP